MRRRPQHSSMPQKPARNTGVVPVLTLNWRIVDDLAAAEVLSSWRLVLGTGEIRPSVRLPDDEDSAMMRNCHLGAEPHEPD